jgi:hypothetical protein
MTPGCEISRYSDGLRAGQTGFDSRHNYLIFPYSKASRPALKLIKPADQCVPGALSPEIKRPMRETDHSPPSSAKIKNGLAITPLLHTSSLRDV